MTMWQSGGMGGHGSQNNPWMKLMGIVHKERRHTDNVQSQSGSNERNLNHEINERISASMAITRVEGRPLKCTKANQCWAGTVPTVLACSVVRGQG
ncbi:hypothetical protein ACLKA7_006438 [Drosophila subpalustris]